MQMRRTTLCLALLTVLTASAQTNYAVVLDTTGANNFPSQRAFFCSDGSTMVGSFGTDGTLLRRTDALGNLMWNKWYADARINAQYRTTTPLLSDNDGGFFIAHTSEGLIFDADWNNQDTVVGRAAITRLASDGSVVWRTDLERFFVAQPPIGFVEPWTVSLAANGQAMIYALIDHDAFGGGVRFLQLVAMDATDGAVLWVRELSGFGLSSSPDELLMKVVCLPGGDAVLALGGTGPSADLLLARVSTTGDLEWMNRYAYGNGAVGGMYTDITVSPTGKIIALGWVAAVAGGGVLYHLHQDGTLDHAELMEVGGFGSVGHLTFVQGGLVLEFSTELLFGDTLGSDMDRHKLHPTVVGGNTLHTPMLGLDAFGPTLLLNGAVHSVDNQFGTWTRRPVLVQAEAQTFSHCADSVSAVPRFQIPLGAIQVTPGTGGYFGPPPGAYAQVATMPAVLVDVPAVATLELCDMVIGMPENWTGMNALNVWPVPAIVGTDLQLNGVEHCSIELFDPHGRRVRFQPASAANEARISTTSLAPGPYLLHCEGVGGSLRSVRVVLH